jgi:hypothetical protein
MGAASEGGYLGADAQSFFSAVVSGAAGSYIVTLTEDAGVGTDLIIEPGQDVRISGDSGLAAVPTWGSGGFVVAEWAALSLSNLALSGSNTIIFAGNGSTVSLASLAVPRFALTALMGSMASRAGTTLKLTTLVGRTDSGTISADGHGGLTATGFSQGVFSVISGPCTTSQGGRCVGRRYSDRDPWPAIVDYGSYGIGPLAERCQIVVLGAGALAPSPLFDTVSYGTSSDNNYVSARFNARHDAVGLGVASCASADCIGDGGNPGKFANSCYVNSYWQSPNPAAPHGCYAGASGPPPGTVLAAGEALTWAAAADASNAHIEMDSNAHHLFRGSASNRASAHGGWELCFV